MDQDKAKEIIRQVSGFYEDPVKAEKIIRANLLKTSRGEIVGILILGETTRLKIFLDREQKSFNQRKKHGTPHKINILENSFGESPQNPPLPYQSGIKKFPNLDQIEGNSEESF